MRINPGGPDQPLSLPAIKIEPIKHSHANSYVLTVGKEKYDIYGEKADIEKLEKLLKNHPEQKDFKLTIGEDYKLKISFGWSLSNGYANDFSVGLSRDTTQASFNKLCKTLGKTAPLLQFYALKWGESRWKEYDGTPLAALKNDPTAAKYFKIEKTNTPNGEKYLIKSHEGGAITVVNHYQDALATIVRIREAIGQTQDQEYFNYKALWLLEKKDESGLVKHLNSNRSAAAAFIDLHQAQFIETAITAEKKYKPITMVQDEKAGRMAKLTEDKSTRSQIQLEFIYRCLIKSGNQALAKKFFERLPQSLHDFKLTTVEKYKERGQLVLQSTLKSLEKMSIKELKEFILMLQKDPSRALPRELLDMVHAMGKANVQKMIDEIIFESLKILAFAEANHKKGEKGDVAVLPRLLALFAPEQTADLIDDYALSEKSKQIYSQELHLIDYFSALKNPQEKLERLNQYINSLDENQKKILEEKFGLKFPLDLAAVSKMELIPLKFLTTGQGQEGVTYFLGIKNSNGTTRYINLSELQMFSNIPEKINIYNDIKNRSELFNTFASHNALPRVSYYVGLRENGSVNVVASQELGKKMNDTIKEYSAYVMIGAGLVATFATGGAAAAAGGLLIAGALHQMADNAYDIYIGQKYGTMDAQQFKELTMQMGMTLAMTVAGPIKGFTGTLVRTGLMLPDSIHTYQILNDPTLSSEERSQVTAFFALNAAMFLWAEKGTLRANLLMMKSKNPALYRELNRMGINEKMKIPEGSAGKNWLQEKLTRFLDQEITAHSHQKTISGIEMHSYGKFKAINGKETIGFFDGKKAVKIQKKEMQAYYDLERSTAGNMARFERAGAVNVKTGEMIRPDQEFFAVNLPREKFPEMLKILKNKNPAEFEKFCRENKVIFRGLESEGHVSALKVYESFVNEKNTASIASEDSNVLNDAFQKKITADKNLVRFEVQPQGTRPSVSDTAAGGLVFIREEAGGLGKVVYAKEGFVKEKLAGAAQSLTGQKGVQHSAKSPIAHYLRSDSEFYAGHLEKTYQQSLKAGGKNLSPAEKIDRLLKLYEREKNAIKNSPAVQFSMTRTKLYSELREFVIKKLAADIFSEFEGQISFFVFGSASRKSMPLESDIEFAILYHEDYFKNSPEKIQRLGELDNQFRTVLHDQFKFLMDVHDRPNHFTKKIYSDQGSIDPMRPHYFKESPFAKFTKGLITMFLDAKSVFGNENLLLKFKEQSFRKEINIKLKTIIADFLANYSAKELNANKFADILSKYKYKKLSPEKIANDLIKLIERQSVSMTHEEYQFIKNRMIELISKKIDQESIVNEPSSLKKLFLETMSTVFREVEKSIKPEQRIASDFAIKERLQRFIDTSVWIAKMINPSAKSQNPLKYFLDQGILNQQEYQQLIFLQKLVSYLRGVKSMNEQIKPTQFKEMIKDFGEPLRSEFEKNIKFNQEGQSSINPEMIIDQIVIPLFSKISKYFE